MLKKDEIKFRLDKALEPLKLTEQQSAEILKRVCFFDVTIDKMAKIESVIEMARYSTRVTEARIGLIMEWLWDVFYGEVTPAQRREIDIHLKDMEKAYTHFMGSEATESERHNYKLYCEHKTVEITRIHGGFGNSIKIQLD